MTMQVVKRSGKAEPFDRNKLRKSIEAACEDCGLEQSRKQQLTDKLTSSIEQMSQGRQEIKSKNIRERLIQELNSIEPKVSESWRQYEKKQRKAEEEN